MEPGVEHSSEEVKRLQRCINDLVSVLALPVLWRGREPAEVVRVLLDALVRTLKLDFAGASVSGLTEHEPIELVSMAPTASAPFSPEAIARLLSLASSRGRQGSSIDGRHVLDGEVVFVAVVPLGLLSETGVVLAGVRRPDFPQQTDGLLLGVATNQALLGLREAELLQAERRIAQELDRRVAERTEELARANAQLYAEIIERARAEEALDAVRSELAHVSRVTSLGALTASITHEINQPLSGILTNAKTCERFLSATPPNVAGASEATRRTIRDGQRAVDVVARLRALFANKPAANEAVDVNDVTREIVALTRSELGRGAVSLRLELEPGLPSVTGDRVQLQQVVLNLILNARDAMSAVVDRPRELLIKTDKQDDDCVRLTVRDSGVGLEPRVATRLFEPFYTTKEHGMGIGLSISRSIIERHHGRLWANRNDGPGSTFSFTLPSSSAAGNC